MFRFAHPEYLYALYLIPILIIFVYWGYIRRKRLLNIFADTPMQAVITGSKSYRKDLLKSGLYIFAFAFAVLALGNPQIGTRVEEVKQIGIDVYILLDVSLSMKAEDLKPNRLEKAKNEISGLMKKLQGDRIGLVVFAGEAYIQFPLTADYSAANLFLSAVDENTVPTNGTAIATAITLAAKSFDEKSATKKVLVLITDGEDHEGDVSAAVKAAREKNMLIYTIGMGSPEGSPIPIYDQQGNQVAFKQDKDGKTVLTKLDETTLQMIANDGGGKYYLSNSYRNELDLIYSDLSKIEKSEYGSKRITDYEDKYYYFLIPSLLLLLIEFMISDRKSSFWNNLLIRLKLKESE